MRTAWLLLSAIVVFGSGIWLTGAGRPYGAALTNVHKLFDLAAVIVIGVMVYQAQRAALLSTLEWAVVGLAAVLTVGAFATGGVLSASEGAPDWVLWAHRVGSWFAGAAAFAIVYLIAFR